MRGKKSNRRGNGLSAKAAQNRIGILVVGMHRSGTSALTRVLSLLGCDLPATMMEANNFNEAGYWESSPIQQLNDRILESAGTHWSDWLEFYPNWFRSPKAGQFHEEALALLGSEFGSSHLFVLKDPRICRMLPFWVGVFKTARVRPLIISPVRNPLEVAVSLARRDGFDPSFSTLLWLRNVLDAEFSSRGLARFFTSFDGLEENWTSLAGNAQTKLGVVWPRHPEKAAGEIKAFLSQGLHHHQLPGEALFKDPAVSRWLAGSYRILAEWAASAESKADFATLDRIRTEFGAAAPAFSQLITAEQKAARKAKSLATELDHQRNSIVRAEQLERELGAAQIALDQKEKQVAVLANLLNDKDNRIAESERRMAALADELKVKAQAKDKAEATLTEARSRLAQTESALMQRRHEADQTAEELASTQAQLKQMRAINAETDKLIAGLKEHAQLLLTDTKERQSQIAQLESEQKALVDETATLKRKEEEARMEADKARQTAARQLGRTVVALLDHKGWSLLPRRVRVKRQMALLEHAGLFDRDWYVEKYDDVRSAGVDPVRHYAEHGAREGREPNSQFERPKS